MRLNGFRVRQRPPIRHSREGGNPRTNIPRKIANRDTTTYVHTAPHFVFPARARPVPRYGAGIQGRWRGGTNDAQTLPGYGHPLSYLGVPAPAGMCPVIQPRCRLSTDEFCRIVDRWPRADGENVARSKTTRGEGLVPRWGRGGAQQNPPCRFAVPSPNSVFSYLGVPAAAGMSDCYESMSRTPIRDRLPPLISSFQRKLESRRGGEG